MTLAPLHSVATENCVRCVCSHLSQGVATERQWGGAPREPAVTAELPALWREFVERRDQIFLW